MTFQEVSISMPLNLIACLVILQGALIVVFGLSSIQSWAHSYGYRFLHVDCFVHLRSCKVVDAPYHCNLLIFVVRTSNLIYLATAKHEESSILLYPTISHPNLNGILLGPT